MSLQLIGRSPDLKRLLDEGYEVSVVSQHLAISGIPYVNSSKEVKRGTLFAKLTLAGDVTSRPESHVVYFSGDHPCDKNGVIIGPLKHTSQVHDLGNGVRADHSFSNKPPEGFSNYYELVSSYVRVISSPAQALDPSAKAQTFAVIETAGDSGVFRYYDTHSSRSDIVAISDKLRGHKIAIVGLGGTGAYLLDFIAKTPVSEIHLFDDDAFHTHNAFRAPGAATIEALCRSPKKVDYLQSAYSAMHKHVIPHPYRIGAENVSELCQMSFVFISVDDGEPRRIIADALKSAKTPFIDVGMGLRADQSTIAGTIRSTLITAAKSDHFETRVPLEKSVDGAYATNIQVAELNALNAALAVISWKKTIGFYEDRNYSHHLTYTIGSNLFLSDENAA